MIKKSEASNMAKLKLRRVRTEINAKMFLVSAVLASILLFIAYKIGSSLRTLNSFPDDLFPSLFAGILVEAIILLTGYAFLSAASELFHKKTYIEMAEVVK